MSGIISARAWGKVWAYRSTFLLGLLNTVETAIFAILLALVLGVIFGLMATSGKKILQVISRVYVAVFLLLCAGFFRSQYRNPADRYRCTGRIHRSLYGRGGARGHRGRP